MKNIVFLFFVLLFSSCALFSPNPNRQESKTFLALKPFTTDYCSEWPDGKAANPRQWADCCFTHDLNYWIGGSEAQRKNADQELKSCVKITGETLGSFLMYIGVRIGGHPGNASYAWGYGWTQDRKYSLLSEDEKERAKDLLKSNDHYQNEKERKLVDSFIEGVLNFKN